MCWLQCWGRTLALKLCLIFKVKVVYSLHHTFLSFTATWLKVSKCLQTSQQAICSNLLMTKRIITTLNMEPTLNLDAKLWPQKGMLLHNESVCYSFFVIGLVNETKGETACMYSTGNITNLYRTCRASCTSPAPMYWFFTSVILLYNYEVTVKIHV